VVTVALVCWAAACGAPSPGAKVTPASQEPTVGSSAPTSAARSGGEDLGVPAGDLHQVDWDSAPLPPQVCGIPGLTTLSNGLARATSQTWGAVTVGVVQVAYGDLLGDDGDEAAVEVYCSNGGGTAASNLEYALAVYTSRSGRLVSLGVLRAQRQDADQRSTLLSVATWAEGSVVVTEHYYRSADGTCCPSGIAETPWRWEGDIPSPGPPHVVQ
jgi:hypothetical protein